ncbi:MAG: PIN domain-containing protein [Chitinispirillales bacterium]|jgi:predicted nucleic acid-binding protein|nr:PIN domain-containing protein [Chitinispirillales bacterium]
MTYFLDTNIFIYAYSEVFKKKKRSFELLGGLTCITSIQVLGEFSNVCFKKLNFSVENVNTALKEAMSYCDVITVNEITILHAVFIKERYGYSYYDCLVIAAALESKCSILYTEDMQHGQIIENSLKIINPFID